jgi:hypothetical protein
MAGTLSNDANDPSPTSFSGFKTMRLNPYDKGTRYRLSDHECNCYNAAAASNRAWRNSLSEMQLSSMLRHFVDRPG